MPELTDCRWPAYHTKPQGSRGQSDLSGVWLLPLLSLCKPHTDEQKYYLMILWTMDAPIHLISFI